MDRNSLKKQPTTTDANKRFQKLSHLLFSSVQPSNTSCTDACANVTDVTPKARRTHLGSITSLRSMGLKKQSTPNCLLLCRHKPQDLRTVPPAYDKHLAVYHLHNICSIAHHYIPDNLVTRSTVTVLPASVLCDSGILGCILALAHTRIVVAQASLSF